MSKISRINIKLPNDMNIFTVIKAYLLKQISDKLYLYIDDRIVNTSINKHIDKIIMIMNTFDIYIDKVIRYSDYYNIIRIYIHRLIKFKNIQITDVFNNSNKYINNYELFSNNYDTLKILLISKNYPDYKHDIYDKGVYNELFLLLIMDYSEKITYIPVFNIYSQSYTIITSILTNQLYFTYPTFVLSNITESFNYYLLSHNKLNTLSIMDIPLDVCHKLGIDTIIDIVKNNISTDNYTVNTTKCFANVNDNTVYLIENPINIILTNNKTINIYNNSINITNNIYIENNNNIFTNERINIKLKYDGMLHIHKQNNQLFGTLYDLSKKKKKKKNSNVWIPQNKPLNKTCFIFENSKKTIGIYSIFDISTKYFIKIFNNIYMFNFNDISQQYSSLILLNNHKN